MGERERTAVKQRNEEDKEAVADFVSERKRIRATDTGDASFMQNMQKQARERALTEKAKATASAANRLRCQVTIKKATDTAPAAPAALTTDSGAAGGLVGYGSDSSDE